ncbi:MAG: NAD(P)/FAD-dependent oxidoreductase [Synergistaceae bacterium]|jgi:2,4-dienoyl-CoA reductase-like NADH-dependent reductase (Old Yellow Enzyme family)/thioredoxin reductase|nr:NAD(P)/FAD-dependent oxidoreductase [Synergistaceae bacterium]
MFKNLFQTIKIGNLELKNRLSTVAMEVVYCEQDGITSERYIDYVEARAKGGWGLIINEATSVSQQGTGFQFCSSLREDRFIEGHKRVTAAVHKHGGKVAVQLIHAGRQTSSEISGVQIVAPSAIKDPTEAEIPHALTFAEVRGVIGDFAKAARRAKEAGYDAVELHGAHGYLIQQFLSPFSNKRGDAYGGNIYNRARFALEIVAEVKSLVGPDFPVLFRMSADELLIGGLTIAETKAFAMMLENAGIHCINVSLGNYTTSSYICPTPYSPKAFTADLAGEIKSAISIPVISVGRYVDPFVAEAAIASGKTDIVGMGRGSLADPEFPNKAKRGDVDDIIQCISCRQGCQGNLGQVKGIECLANPLTGHEGEYPAVTAKVLKKVAVAGGGVSGMEAAIAARRRGHAVTLFEKTDTLGGQWLLAAIPPTKHELGSLIWWQKRQMEKLGIQVKMNHAFSPDDAKGYDAVIVATGSKPIVPKIPGIDSDKVVLASELLSGKKDAGRNVVVLGGGQVGCETASFLGTYSKEVTVLEMLDTVAKDGEPIANFFLFEELKHKNVNIVTGAKVLSIEGNRVIYEKGGQKLTMENIDNVVLAAGVTPDNSVAQSLKDKGISCIVIGDADTPGNAFKDMKQAYNVGYHI